MSGCLVQRATCNILYNWLTISDVTIVSTNAGRTDGRTFAWFCTRLHCVSKNVPCQCSLSSSNITRFSKFFQRNILYTICNIPPHLKCVATLPCEIQIFKNRHDQKKNTYAKIILWNYFLLLFTLKLRLLLHTLSTFVNKGKRLIMWSTRSTWYLVIPQLAYL